VGGDLWKESVGAGHVKLGGGWESKVTSVPRPRTPTTAHTMSDVLKQTTIANKRKSGGSSAAPKKKARTSAKKDPHASARALVSSINASPETFDLPEDDDDVRQTLVSLAAYFKTLEPVEKSSSQIAAEVERLRRTAVSGIMKQMTVSLDASPRSGYALYCTLSYFDALY
jgi:hypothetical protein